MTLSNEIWQSEYLAFVAQVMPSRLVILKMDGAASASFVDGKYLAPQFGLTQGVAAAQAGGVRSNDGTDAIDVSEVVVMAPVTLDGRGAGNLIAAVPRSEAALADARIAGCAAALQAFKEARYSSLYRKVIEAANEGIVVTTPGPSSEIVYSNDAFARMTGYTREQLLGTSMLQVLTSEADGAGVFTEHGIASGEARCSVSSLMRQDGQVRRTEVCIVPLAPSPNAPRYYAAIHRDVCDRLDRELAISQSERRFRSIVEDSRDWFVLIDVQGNILYESSAHRLLGTEDANAVGMTIYALVHPDDAAGLQAAVQSAVDDAALHPRVTYRLTKGNRRHEGIIANRLADPDVNALVITSRDVSDRALIDEHIARADRLASLGTLAGGVAHEINNPLTYIASNLDFIGRCLHDAPGAMGADIADAIRDATAGVKRVQRIVRELGEFSSPRVGDSPVDVAAMLRRAITLAQNEIRHRAELVVEIDAGIPSVYGSEAKLTQVFVSLLLNAAQAIPENTHGQVAVTAARLQGAIRIDIADSGVGIEPDVGSQVFDPFFTTKEVGKGTGLGLSFCHATVTAMGGTIAHSPREGGGTVFRITFPPSAQEIAPVLTSLPRLLLVDDEPLVTRALKRLLEDAYDCEQAVGGQQALDMILGGGAYDCILCDVMMPQVSGVDVFTQVLLRRPELAPRFVFLTGGSFTPQASQFLSTVANQIVAKPVDVPALKAAIEESIRKGG